MIAKGLKNQTSKNKRKSQSMENIFADNEKIANNKSIKNKWQLQKFKILKDAEDKLRELDETQFSRKPQLQAYAKQSIHYQSISH